MPHIEQRHQCSNGQEGDRPGYAHVHAAVLQQPCQSHQTALTQHQTHAVEGVADAYVELLIDVGEAQDIEAIGRDVVCGTGKSDEHEQRQRSLKPHGSGQTECHSRQRGSHKQLHGEYPPAFGAEGINERTPQRLDDPWQAKPARVKGYLRVTEPHLLIEHH